MLGYSVTGLMEVIKTVGDPCLILNWLTARDTISLWLDNNWRQPKTSCKLLFLCWLRYLQLFSAMVKAEIHTMCICCANIGQFKGSKHVRVRPTIVPLGTLA